MTFIQPSLWGPDQLEIDIATSIAAFRGERFEESAELYPEIFDKVCADVEVFLEQTIDLSDLLGSASAIVNDSALLNVLRYLAGPPISADDLEVLLEVGSKIAFKDPDVQARLVDTIRATLDRRRFPWVSEDRPPTEEEKHAAIIASAALMATQRVSTWRRTQAKTNQETRVQDSLIAAGFRPVTLPRTKIRTAVDGPQPGEFCGEVVLGTRKADIVVRLWDTRLLPIECKVSNSFINSVKRLNNDAAVKATTWKVGFGDLVVPAAVIAGAYNRRNIEDAQSKGLMIIWAHRLSDLTDFIASTR